MERTAQVLAGAGLGAALMYFLDPQAGRRRRAGVRDQFTHLSGKARDAADIVSRDARNRVTGLFAGARAATSGKTPDDRTLAERVRSHLGWCVSHPHAIAVSAEDGRVRLSGPILGNEVNQLIESVNAVPGVRGIINELDIHDHSGNIPSLQGGVPRTGACSTFARANWPPAVRALAGAVGVGLMANCLAQRRLLPALLGTVGFGLFVRAVTNTRLGELLNEAKPIGSTEGNPELGTAAAAGPVL